MDLLKAKIFLDKINRDFARMQKDPDNILRIDVDIMVAHIRDLYDAMLSEAETQDNRTEQAPRRPAPPRQQDPVEPPPPVASIPPPPPVASIPPPPPVMPAPPAPTPFAEPAPPPEEKPAPAPPPPVVAEPIKTAEPLPVIKPPAPAAPSAPPLSFPAVPPEAEALFEQKQAKELSEKLSDLPIPDLRKAIALNDRLLLTRELFGGDNQAFENAINTLNSFSGFEQAKSYLLEQCVMRYRWMDKKHMETAKNFIKLVRRRFK